MPQPPEIEALPNPLIALYRAAWERVLAEQGRIAADPARWRRRDRLAEIRTNIEREIDLLQTPTRQWLELQFPRAYGLGVANGVAATGGTITGWTSIDRIAVQELSNGLFDDLLKATTFVKDDTKRFIRDVIRSEALQKAIAGDTATNAARVARRLIEEKGVAAVVYRNGARHGLSDYSEMAMRSTTAIAYNRGTLNADRTIEWFEIFDGHDCIAEGSGFAPYGGLRLLARGRYQGPMYTIRAGANAARAHTFTVGPHHPVLTRRGWVPARLLREGDELVYDPRCGNTADGPANAEFDEMPRVEDVFASLLELGCALEHRSPIRDDFHGDAEGVKGEIEVVRPAGSLLAVRETGGVEYLRELALVGADDAQFLLTGAHAALYLTSGLVGAAPSSLSLGDSSPAAFRALALSSHPVARAYRSLRDAFLAQDPANRRLTGVEPESDRRRAQVFVYIQADNLAAVDAAACHVPILSIATDDYDGWVYDATTGSGAFATDGFVVKNCGLSFHEDPTKANGMVVDRKTAEAFPIAHPRCQRSLGPRPDITSAAQAKRAEPSTTTDQRADQARAEVERRERFERRAAIRSHRASLRRQASPRRERSLQKRLEERRQRIAARHPSTVPAKISDQLIRNFPPSQAPQYAPIEASLRALDEVLPFATHMPVLPVEVVNLPPGLMGATSVDTSVGQAVRIRISTQAATPMLTMAHETFHVVDLHGIAPTGAFATAPLAEQLRALLSFASIEQPPVSLAVRRWWDAVTASDSYKRLDQWRAAGLLGSTDADYLLYPHELFARSGAQFIAKHSTDQEMKDELERVVSGFTLHLYAEQWEDDDFDAIDQALLALFRELQWMS